MTHDVFGSLMQNIRENECVQLQDDLFNTVSVKIGKKRRKFSRILCKKRQEQILGFYNGFST